MGIVENTLRNVCAALASIFLVVTILLGNLIQLPTLLVRPFSSRAFREVNCFLVAAWWTLFIRVFEWAGRVQPILSGHLGFNPENALLIANHQSMADIPGILIFAERSHRLDVVKWYVKEPLKHLPGVGWGLQFMDCLFVKRNWYADRGKIETTFRKFKEQKIPYWLVSFSEGTRMTPAKRKESQAFAKSKHLPVLENVMIPRSRGFLATVEGLRGSLEAIYDITIAFEPWVPSLWKVFRGELARIFIHVERFPLDALPNDEKSLSEWLLARFVEKDQRLARFKVQGVLK